MCRYKDGEAMVRVRKTTRAKLAALADYYRAAAQSGRAEAWWARDDGPGQGEVIERLIRFYDNYRDRRRRAGEKRTPRRRKGPSATGSG